MDPVCDFRQYPNAIEFLADTQDYLMLRECANGLMLGLALSLRENLLRFGSQPFMATVWRRGSVALAALMTPPYKLQIVASEPVGTDLLDLLAAQLIAGGWGVPAVLAVTDIAERFGRAMAARTGARTRRGMRERVHELRSVKSVPRPRGSLRIAREEDITVLSAWTRQFQTQVFGQTGEGSWERLTRERIAAGSLYVWDDGGVVSMAGRARPTPHGEAISLVYTPAKQRRKGYATASVAALASRILSEGKAFCTLYTDLANPTSNAIYAKVGFVPVADLVDIEFEGP